MTKHWKRNTKLDGVDDIVQLDILDDQTLLECIKQRFQKGKYYTYVGDTVIAVNPCQNVPIYSSKEHELYTNIRDRSSQPAHIFWAADSAFRSLQDGNGQCIVVTGDSGAGKTESTKFILNHLVHLDGKSTGQHDLITKLEKINLVLEFFGNAETCLNQNSSRFAKLIEISYTDDNTIEYAKIEAYILEKFRVTQPNRREKNFHAFHALFAGMSEDELQDLKLEDPCDYRILTTFKNAADQKKYQGMYIEMVRLFDEIGLERKIVDEISNVLSAILHLTNVRFDEDPDGAAGIGDPRSYEYITTFCGLLNLDTQDSEELEKFLLVNEIRGDFKTKTITQAEDGRDSLARELYACVFYGIIDIVNSMLAKPQAPRSKKTIRILDVSGFENIPNQNSLEQLLINTVNENLQQYFLKRAIKDEYQEFILEDLSPTIVNFTDNTENIELLYESPRSIFAILNDSVTLPPSHSNAFLDRLEQVYPELVIRALRRESQDMFKIHHYADTVWYNPEDFLQKNRDTVSTSLGNIIMNCQNTFVQQYFQLGSSATTSKNRGGRASFRGDPRLSGSSSFNKTGKLVGRVTDNFRNSLKRMMEKIQTLQPVFIRCIKPNNSLLPSVLDSDLVRKQLENSGIMDVAKVRSTGYPVRIPFMEFYKRYKPLLEGTQIHYSKEATERILGLVQIHTYEMGKTKVFLKMEHRDELEAKLIEKEEAIKKAKEEKRALEEADRLQRRLEKEKEAAISSQADTLSKTSDGMFDSQDSGLSSMSSTFKLSSAGSIDTSDQSSNKDYQTGNKDYQTGNKYYQSGNKDYLSSVHEEMSEDEKEKMEEPDGSDKLSQKGQERRKTPKKDPRYKREPWEAMCISERDCENSNDLEVIVRRYVRLFMYLILFVYICGCCTMSRLSLMWITQDTYPSKDLIFLKLTGCLTVPMIIKWLSCLVKTIFGSKQYPSKKAIAVLTCIDILQTSARWCFVLLVMPKLSPLEITIISLTVCILPSFFNIISECSSGSQIAYELRDTQSKTKKQSSKPRFYMIVVFSVFALLVQMASLVVLLTFGTFSKLGGGIGEASKLRIGSMTVMVCVFVSVGWWENFAFGKLPLCNVDLSEIRKILRQVRLTSYIYSGPVQIIISGLMSLYIIDASLMQSFEFYWESFSNMFFDKDKIIQHFKIFGLMYIQMLSTYLSAYCSGIACRLHMQRFGFALPIIVVPIVTTVLGSLCTPSNLWWEIPEACVKLPTPSGQETWVTLGIGIVVYISYLFISRHIWFPKLERMAKLERLFSFGYADPVFPDVCLALKRRQDEAEKEEYKKKVKEVKIPMVYICATMWHEIRQEMVQLCKSLFRIDFDICKRYLANKNFGAYIDDLYTAEIHIIFDDAFFTDEKTKQRVVNSYVEELIKVMPDACSSVSKGSVTLDPVKKISTPYGGRLEWIMPGGTRMEVHLKDKNKIRHKKRWSQIMYMYYLLGHKLLKDYSSAEELLREYKTSNKSAVRPQSSLLNKLPSTVVEEAANTFIMALDGDVDFGPEAVRLLIDRMKKNRDVAAVCGRIHPIGSGPMVWYQQFEYSVGHWLQKATENVLGCVLCCPGCFSLFRGLSLMDDNVMRLYAKEPTEAVHYIQYEQGEDRWLCTLLLQQGYKIDYCAGSDAFTYAPETFNDFYIQRRRWSPSTMANVMDLIGSWKSTIKMNNNISTLFMLYQFVLMASSILAPGTVTYMISGSYKSVLGLNPWQAYLLSTVPVLLYVLLCLKAKTETQVAVAAVLSAVYAIVMVIVSIGTVINIVEENFLTPNVLFLIGLSAIFVVTAIIHPKELMCLVHGILYYLTVPSTFVFLTVFFLCNLNIVSWGTREAPKKVEVDEEGNTVQPPPKKSKIRKFIDSLGISSVADDLRSFLKQMLGNKDNPPSATPNRDLESGLSTPLPGHILPKPKPKGPRKPKERVVIIDPDYWKTNELFQNGTDGELEEHERIFWEKLITKFLLPLKENKEKQDQIAADLISIRNNVVFAYFLLNFMFTLVILQLELKQDILKDKFYIDGKYEPVSVLFLGVFSILIVTQFVSMLIHRWGTFLLLISSTDIALCKDLGNDNTSMALKQIEEMQRGEREQLSYGNSSDSECSDLKLDELIIDYSDDEEGDDENPPEQTEIKSKYEKIVEKEHKRRQSIVAISDRAQAPSSVWVAESRRDHKTMAVRNLYRNNSTSSYQDHGYYQPSVRNPAYMLNGGDPPKGLVPRVGKRTRRESVFEHIPECDYD